MNGVSSARRSRISIGPPYVTVRAVSAFEGLSGMNPIDIWEGVSARTVEGDGCSFAVVELDPHSVVPEHKHPNEQLGLVIRGSVSFRVADETRDLGPGETWRIPPDTPHEVHTGPEGAIVLDVFAPAREDWKALERSDARAPLWP
jgi:quercetin dioxygenase-like cupin family protein